jgi:hypothetical protein
MPSKQRRSSTRLRPPFFEGFRFGMSGWKSWPGRDFSSRALVFAVRVITMGCGVTRFRRNTSYPSHRMRKSVISTDVDSSSMRKNARMGSSSM